MDLTVTLAILAGAVALAVLCGWRGARPSDPSRGPRMVPWRMLMALFTVAAALMLVHLINLMGVHTGR